TVAALVTGVLPALINLITVLFVATIGVAYLLGRREVSAPLLQIVLLPLLIVIVLGLALALLLSNQELLAKVLDWLVLSWARLRRRPYDPSESQAVLEHLQ